MKYGSTTKKASIVYGPSNTGKKTAISKILKDEGFYVITISDQKKMSKSNTFVHYGVCGKHAYIVDVDNMRGFPRIPSKKLDDSYFQTPVVYVCIDPFAKTKGTPWRDIQRDFSVFQSDKDHAIVKHLKKNKSRESFVHKKDPYPNGTPPWILMSKISSNTTDMQDKLQAVGSDPMRVFNILRNNVISVCTKDDIEKAGAYVDILCDMDKTEALAKKASLFGDPGEYQACGIIQCVSALGITNRTKLSYKTKYELVLGKNLSIRDSLYCRESFPSLCVNVKQKRGRKRKTNNSDYGRFS